MRGIRNRITATAFGPLAIAFTIIPLTSCARTLWHSDDLEVVSASHLDTIQEYSEHSKSVYETDALKSHKTQLFFDEESQVKALLVEDQSGEQLVVFRGTANLKNALVDATYKMEYVDTLSVPLHEGFYSATQNLYQSIHPHLDQSRPINVTGHSLGGAIAAVFMMMLERDDYQIGKGITFGQPKVTNIAGVQKYRHLPLIRVVNDKDIVPMAPPATLLTASQGSYRHFGKAMNISNQSCELHSEEGSEMVRNSSFWLNLFAERVEDHFMDNYVKNLQSLDSVSDFQCIAPSPQNLAH